MVDLPEANEALASLESLFVDAHETAISRWRELCSEHPALGAPCDSTTRANFINDHVAFEMTRLVDERPGTEVADGLGFFALRLEPAILLRFKFLGQGTPSNVSTTQQKLLARQTFTDEMMFALEGDTSLLPPTLLTCGYTIDGDGKLGRVEIRRDCKGHQSWNYDIYGGKVTTQPLVLDGLADTTKPARITKPSKTDVDDGETATG